jgi:hypothetical protein
MPTKKDLLKEELRTNGGNAQAAALAVGASIGYALRIKKEMPQVGIPHELVVPPELDLKVTEPQQLLTDIVPANIEAVVNLRDDLIEDLHGRVKRGSLNGRSSVDLLSVLLKYETELRAVLQPVQAIFEDNSQHLTINGLTDKMQEFDPADLRRLAGAVEAETIDIIAQEK